MLGSGGAVRHRPTPGVEAGRHVGAPARQAGALCAVVSPTALWREALTATLTQLEDRSQLDDRPQLDDRSQLEDRSRLDDRHWSAFASVDAIGPDTTPVVVVTTRASVAAAAARRWPGARTVVLAVDEPADAVGHHPGSVVVLRADASVEQLRSSVWGQGGAARRSWQPTRLAPPPLTRRERVVMEGVAEGRSARDIAASMGVSLRTVEAHKQRVFAKWAVRSQSQAVELALRHGLITVRSA